jgi:hypothetical protein
MGWYAIRARAMPVLYLRQFIRPYGLVQRLALELFRGEPAISQFVRHFTTYPQVIAKFCNICAFGLPCRVTGTSSCPWVAHQVSGLFHATCALFGLAFAAARRVSRLTLPRKITRWVILQEARPKTSSPYDEYSPRTARRHAVSGTISLPLSWYFSPFPHGTRSLSVAKSI